MSRQFVAIITLLAVVGAWSAPLFAQVTQPTLIAQSSSATQSDELLTLQAKFVRGASGQVGLLRVEAKLAKGWHTYSVTQPKGGPIGTSIALDDGQGIRLLGDFHPETPPDSRKEPLFDNLTVEEHHDRVTWVAPIEFADGASAVSAIKGKVRAQLCDESGCRPPKSFAFSAPAEPTQEAVKGPHVFIQGRIDPGTVAPNGQARLTLTIAPTEGYHAYALADRDPKQISKPTLLVVTETSGLRAGKPAADKPIIEVDSEITPGEKVRYYDGPVTLTVDLQVPADAANRAFVVAGILGYQTCTEESCDPPTAVRFLGTVRVGEGGQPSDGSVVFSSAKYGEASAVADVTASGPTLSGLRAAAENTSGGNRNLAAVFGLAFLAGLILNVMPCVLPVIGLKILSFVQQAGESRGRVLALNLWYTLGIMTVFMALATAAVVFNQGWGGQFQDARFTITMTAVVWICALSFLGVWEIPIPGFAMSSSANQAAAKEGPLGAFLKGILTTLLATPCTGPFLITTLTWAIHQPAPITYATFAAMGLGMASPYVLIGAFPRLVGFLPKPGAWMNTFKQFMGFVLLGTVVFLLYSVPSSHLNSTMGLLAGLSFGCWWIGRVPLMAEKSERRLAWGVSIAIAALVGGVAFGMRSMGIAPFDRPPHPWLVPTIIVGIGLSFAIWWIGRTPRKASIIHHVRSWTLGGAVAALAIIMAVAPEKLLGSDAKLPWEPFSRARLEELVGSGKTVLVDFTASWCQSCKFNEYRTLNTSETLEVVREFGVVPLLADKSDDSPEIDALLTELGNEGLGIPFLAIFPAGAPDKPITLENLISKSQLADAIRRAGPSRDAVNNVRVATTASP